MIKITLENHRHFYPVSDVLRMFCQKVTTPSAFEIIGDHILDIEMTSILNDHVVSTQCARNIKLDLKTQCRDDKEVKREIKRQIYYVLSQITGITFPWGALTGIRPTLVAREVNSSKILTDKYFVRKDKAERAMIVAKNEDRIIDAIPSDMMSLYIGIPFCPSRCSYCSFISKEMSSHKTDFLNRYVDAMIYEINMLSDIIHGVESIYIGGGTPTVLNEALLYRLLTTVARHTSTNLIREYTVEAGRPETVNMSKLKMLKDFGVTRICINPQSLSDDTLMRIGRKHSVQDFYHAFEATRDLKFNCINTDLIAGLPGETPDIFKSSMDGIIKIRPDNITIHTLYKKRAAQMEKREVLLAQSAESVDSMLSYADAQLDKMGYNPYYLYKQKDTVGGHENIGYAREGQASIYNVVMMSDQFSVLAVGAGGISKRAFHDNRLERCHCVRDPDVYISRIDDMVKKKQSFFV